MKKLNLQHLAPYLPYGINFMCIDPYSREYEILPIVSIELAKEEMQIGASDYDFTDIGGRECKIVLKPLSDLTKEIEHNGEKFTPTYKLFEIEYCGTTHVDGIRNIYTQNRGRFLETSHYGTAAQTSVNIIELFHNNYWKIKQLLEWHFDVFGLIDKGLAVDINDLK